ncbi:endolytic transglycosylase MltG [Patescibacteria group bacterium]|nr:endolytic transglycosylase MltG [Patescibacteria group bacterium]
MSKKLSKKATILISVALIFTALVLFYVSSLLKPLDVNSTDASRFVIPKGQAISIIGQRLQEEKLIKNAYVFRFVVVKDKLVNKIQAGSFDISPSMSVSEIANHLTIGTEDIWITLLEGWRVEEIAESLESQDLDHFDKEEFLNLAKASEGMLYPDTYLIPREMSSEAIYRLLLNTFEKKVIQGLANEIKTSDRDFDQVLIMASLLEREAKTYEQMRRVAGILWNRIDIGMALQVDATLQYANGYNQIQKKWWAIPSSEDKKLKSPFNTYLNLGLPLKAISNPGINAIKAALMPLESNDFFYIHANDGSIYYASTLEAHNANINKYLR